MQCWQCGADVRPGQRTCDNCGARLTSPPDGRSQNPPQSRYPSQRDPQRDASRRPRDDGWDDSEYAPGYAPDDDSTYRPDTRGSGRRGTRPHDDDDWDDDRPNRRQQQSRGRSRGGQGANDHGDYGDYGRQSQSGYDQSGVYDDDDASSEYDAPNPLDDPRAPRNLRANPRRGSDARGGRSQGGRSQGGSRDDRQGQTPPDGGDGRSRRPPEDARSRRDDGAYRGRGYGQQGMLPPLTEERQGYGSDSYDEPGRSRRSQPSSADNRYSRSSVSRGQPGPYGERHGGGDYDEYSDEYDASANDSRRGGYGRNIGDRSYPQDGMQQRSWQQRWEETFGSVRIPGVRRQEETAESKDAPRRLMTTIVAILVLVAVLVAGVVVVGPRILQKLQPSTTSSSLCTPSGSATPGTLPSPPAHFKQATSTRSRYGISYPETWTLEQQQKAATGYDYIDVYTLPNSPTSVTIEQAEAACALADINIIQGEVAVAQQQNITFTEVTSAATTQTIGGEKWQRREYDVNSKGVTLHMVILACHHQGRAYVIVLVSRTTTFAKDNTGIFEPMLKSFAFTK